MLVTAAIAVGVFAHVSVTKNNGREFTEALQNGDAQSAVQLLQAGKVDLSSMAGNESQGEVYLQLAIKRDLHDVVRELVLSGVDPNYYPNIDRRSPLHLAASFDANRSIEELVLLGADTSLKDGFSQTPLMVCVVRDNIVGAGILLEHGADVSYMDSRNRGLLHWAQSESMIELLKKHGATTESAPDSVEEEYDSWHLNPSDTFSRRLFPSDQSTQIRNNCV